MCVWWWWLFLNQIGLIHSVCNLIFSTVCHKNYSDKLFFRKTGFNNSIVFFDITISLLLTKLLTFITFKIQSMCCQLFIRKSFKSIIFLSSLIFYILSLTSCPLCSLNYKMK